MMKCKEIAVISKPSPFSSDTVRIFAEPGQTISEILEDAEIPLALMGFCVATINGDVIPQQFWHVVRPKSGTVINFVVVPHGGGGGGGGKSPLRTILSIAVIAASFYFGPILGKALQLSTAPLFAGASGLLGQVSVASLVGGAIISVAGNALVNAIAPPAAPGTLGNLSGSSSGAGAPESPTLSITGAQNRANQFGVVPRVYGRHRVHPLFAAQPFTEEFNGDQYLFMLFDFGYGPIELSSLQIGTSPLANFEGVEIEIREGRTTDAAHRLYRNQNATDQYNVVVSQAGGSKTVISRANTDELILGLTFRGLVKFNDSGNRTKHTVEATIEYRDFDVGGAFTALVAGDEVEIEVATATRATLIDGERFVEFSLDDKVSSGCVKVSIDVPEIQSLADIHGMRHAIYTRVVGETNYQKQYEDDEYVLAGESVSPDINVIEDELMEFKIVQLSLGLEQGSGPWDGENLASTPAVSVPNVAFTYKRFTSGTLSKFTDDTAQQVFRSIRIKPGSKKRWEVRTTRVTADSDDSQTLDEFGIEQLRSIEYADPIAFEVPHCTVALKIKATDQLNGVLDEFTAIAHSILDIWDGNQFNEGKTRNAAWAYIDVLRGPANKEPVADDRIDIDAIAAWAAANDAQAPQNSLPEGVTADEGDAYWNCDLVVDFNSTVFDILKLIASTSRSTPAMKDGKFSIVRDVEQSVPVQVFTPRNSSAFRGKVHFIDQPHAMRVVYVDPDKDWEQNEVIVYDDGFNNNNATKFEEMGTVGITNRAQAWREGRYQITVARLRNETFELNCDIENLICSRGDLVEVANDIPSIGGQAVRVDSITVNTSILVTTVTFDVAVSMTDGFSYVIRTRKFDGSVITTPVDTVQGETFTVTLTTPVGAASAPEEGELAVFGISTSVTANYIIKDIEPSGELGAKLIMVPEAVGVHQADSGTVTVDTSGNAVNPETALPAAVSLVATQENLTKNNRFQYDIILDWSMPNGQYAAAFEIYRLQPNGTYKFEAVTSAKSYRIDNLDGGQSYGFKIRSMNGDSKGLALSASASISHTIVAIPPGDVQTFNGDVVDRSIILNWTAPTDTVNLASYEIRFTTLTSGAQWSDSTLVGGTAFPGTTKTLTALSGTYLIKAVDIAGTESANALTLVTTIGTYDFNGTVDLGDIFTCIVKSEMTVAAFNASLSFDAALGLFDDQGGTFDINGAGSAPVSAEMFVRIKDTGGGSFGPWLPVMSSLLTFRFAEFNRNGVVGRNLVNAGVIIPH